MTSPTPEFETLSEAKAWLRANVERGARCPCCNQMAKVYKRPLSSVVAQGVIALYREAGTGFAHLPTVVKNRMPKVATQGGYASLGVHWGLILEEHSERPDGGRAGWWRVTPKGVEFAEGRLFVPKYAHIYDGKVLGLSGPRVDVRTALGTRFDYRTLMHG